MKMLKKNLWVIGVFIAATGIDTLRAAEQRAKPSRYKNINNKAIERKEAKMRTQQQIKDTQEHNRAFKEVEASVRAECHRSQKERAHIRKEKRRLSQIQTATPYMQEEEVILPLPSDDVYLTKTHIFFDLTDYKGDLGGALYDEQIGAFFPKNWEPERVANAIWAALHNIDYNSIDDQPGSPTYSVNGAFGHMTIHVVFIRDANTILTAQATIKPKN